MRWIVQVCAVVQGPQQCEQAFSVSIRRNPKEESS